ncbi:MULTISPECIES: ABC transporter permease [unclassified Massilia]|uniref:MlaE family ABC transporter permease n=1 Tax=unclassified Massilia TaxID=2609279 RepID=UPI001781E172|nr:MULTISPECIES: ABC transporter permease [unclassified Massilia]MBD8530144.1 ABC transporter permease [Massilia sp. CFBP 13647]MBD8674027.1 ABC transporter permease [Massilia sp. CFBP 13721]
MRRTSHLATRPSLWGRALVRYLRSWWYMLFLGAVAIVSAFSPSSYRGADRRANRLNTARYIHASTWQVLPWFTLLSALISLVIIRIVLVTAMSYGLSRYALEMVVRVLVLELIPLSAALFAALRSSMAFDASALGLARAGLPQGEVNAQALRRLRRDLVPQLFANAFSVLSLAMVSSTIVLLLAYLNVYGLSPWGLPDYTRTVGRVFEPVVAIGFMVKTVLFGLAVAVIPTAAILELQRYPRRLRSSVQPGALRLLFVLLLIEGASLALKYI